MTQINIRHKIFFILLTLFPYNIKTTLAQTTYNPYSMQGLGEIEMGEYGRNAGMAGVSIGVRSQNFLNNSNPASLTILDSTSFVYDFSSAMKFSSFQSLNQNENTFNFNFKKLALGFKVAPRWAISIGLSPYSSVGYKVNSTDNVEGGSTSSTTSVNFDGDGGINKFYLSNGFQLTKNISFGINSSILFGSINNNVIGDNYSISETSKMQKLYFDFGVQYYNNIKDLARYTIGVVYGYKAPVQVTNSTNVILGIDTVKSGTSQIQYLPMFYGLGASVCFKNKLTLAADYQFQQWTSVTSNVSSIMFSDMNKLKLGAEFVPDENSYKSYFQRVHYQCGFSIYNSYLNIGNYNPINYTLSLGIGLPIRKSALMNIAVNYGKFGSMNNDQIQENFTQVVINFSFTDLWFVKRKYD
jgi:hypothetical protein